MAKNKRKKKPAKLTPHEKKWGKLPRLREADIVVVRIEGSLLRKLLRRVTGSYWDHSALVLSPVIKAKGAFHNLIIEAVNPNGIQIHKLEKYLHNPEKFTVGIKRVPDLNNTTRERIVSFMLMNIDAPYYKLKLWRFILAFFSKKYTDKLLGRQRYCCSGFVQKAYYEAASWDNREEYIFREDFLSPIELQDIVTPGDLASTAKSEWIYNGH